MPQSERAKVIKDMLSWLLQQKNGVTIRELIQHVEWEISEMGASTRTIEGYIRRCKAQGLITVKGFKVICTQKCKNWLEKKVS